jgi:fermentation-respiration switch protein FrsA (DUF1100 family)
MATPTRIRQTVREERRVPGGRRLLVDFGAGGDAVPAVLALPDAAGPVPAVLLLHGYSSRKEHLADSLGPALLARGIASLAVDLPLHGSRADTLQMQASRNPLAMMGLWRQARRESALAAGYLRARAEVDAGRTAVLGYSLGSYLAAQLAAEDRHVRALVVAAGGDLPDGTPLSAIARTVADPLRAVRKLAGRPLLVIHGKNDRTVRPAQAERLYAAAGQPKEIRWWDAGHVLPLPAIAWTAEWIARTLAAGAPA